MRDARYDTDSCWGIVLIDCATKTPRLELVDRAQVVINQPRSLQEAKKLFLGILKLWIGNAETAAIPYVWGGCSFIERLAPRDFKYVTAMRDADEIGNWQRTSAPGVHTGFDCTGVLLRAAQVAGIAYFCKNSTTLGKDMKDVAQGEALEDGDIILIPRHVLIVSSLKNNTVIDTSSYSGGDASLQERPLLAKLNVKDFAALRLCAETKQPIERVNFKGEKIKDDWVRLIKLRHQDF